jgi:putative oxidoreductase
MKFLGALQPVGLFVLRVALGIIFVYHGYPKLAHAGGGTQGFFVQHGLPGYFVYVSGILETFGGLLLILGLFTRAAGLLLAVEMGVAIWKVHSANGYMAVRDYEFPMLVGAACLALATVGAGLLSADYPLFESAGGRSRAPKPAKNR